MLTVRGNAVEQIASLTLQHLPTAGIKPSQSSVRQRYASTKLLKRSDQSNRGSSVPSRPAEQLGELLDDAVWLPDPVVNLNLQKSGDFLQILRHDFELSSLKSGKLADIHV
ncbi:hypothetical protein LMG29660_03996 [Burkholderia puraquae]|uniref:Uncharacterized protein n=1 Tax=Burkholderia puraquae TaxID=1904757 RepID=A0A6J5E5T0_9BURK|nr:hypothetical protein LMG29660_03996 [Burkholderia puraquae]